MRRCFLILVICAIFRAVVATGGAHGNPIRRPSEACTYLEGEDVSGGSCYFDRCLHRRDSLESLLTRALTSGLARASYFFVRITRLVRIHLYGKGTSTHRCLGSDRPRARGGCPLLFLGLVHALLARRTGAGSHYRAPLIF